MKDQLITSIRAIISPYKRIDTNTYYILIYKAGEIICDRNTDKSYTLCSMSVDELLLVYKEVNNYVEDLRDPEPYQYILGE